MFAIFKLDQKFRQKFVIPGENEYINFSKTYISDSEIPSFFSSSFSAVSGLPEVSSSFVSY